jgi:RimJ/RimL family protein N-acetyltransferase
MFSITPLQESDIADMYQAVQSNQHTLVELGWLTKTDWERFCRHYQSIVVQKKLQIFAVRVDGEYAGSVEVSDRGDHHQIGYWLGMTYRGQGIATEAVRSVINQLDPRPVCADTLIENQASWQVLERLGFELEKTGETNRFYRLTRDK